MSAFRPAVLFAHFAGLAAAKYLLFVYL